MRIVCPHCNFTKELDSSKIPAGAKKATCPKCRNKFDLIPADEAPQAPPPLPPQPPPIPDVGRSAPESPRFRSDTDFTSPPRTDFEAPRPGPPPLPPRPPQARVEAGEYLGGGGDIPWEERSGSFFGDFLSTTKMVLLSPGRFFEGMTIGAGYKAPLLYGLICGSAGIIFSIFWQAAMIILGAGMGGMMSPGMAEFDPTGMMSGLSTVFIIGFFILILILAPIFAVIGLYIGSAIVHVLLAIVGGAGGGFEATFRVLAYASAGQLLNIVPFVGGFVGGIWGFVISLFGLPKVHNTGIGRVLIAIFVIPVILIIGLAIVISILAAVFS